MDTCAATEWFLKIELLRVEYQFSVYNKTIRLPDAYGVGIQPIHRFYYERLVSDRFNELHSKWFIHDLSCKGKSNFLERQLRINGQSYTCLRSHFAYAERVLNRDGSLLSKLPVAFGFGDGHGGNFMVTEAGVDGDFLFIDYEVSGFHSPILDMVKPIYFDAFFSVFYDDQLGVHNTSSQIDMSSDTEAISIEFKLNFDTLTKAIAKTKLQYLLKPTLEHWHQGFQKEATEVLSYGLLTCALLTRSFTSLDTFLLNLGIGVLLANDMARLFSEVFGWNDLCSESD